MQRLIKIASLGVLTAVALMSTPQSGKSQVTDARVKRALQTMELGGEKQAVTELRKLTSESPKNAEAHAALAIALLKTRAVDEALTSAQTAFDLDRKVILGRIARGMVFGEQGKVGDALKEFNQAIRLDDKEMGSYLALARYYLKLDSNKQAEVMLYRAQAINDKDVRSYLGLGELYEKQRIPDLAIAQYESAKKLDASDVTVSAKLAALYFKDRRYTESINEWIAITRADSTFSQAYYQIGRLYYLADQQAKAVAYVEKYTMMEPDDIYGHWLLAQALAESGQYGRALPALEKVAMNDSLKGLSQLLLAKSYVASKEYPKAIDIYKNAKNLSNADFDFYGRAALLIGDTTLAITALKQALVNDTSRTDAQKDATRKMLASTLLGQKRGAEAAEIFKELALARPTVDNWIGVAYYYGQAGMTDQAVEAYEKALAADPNSMKTWMGLGQLHAGKEASTPKMKQAFEKALALAEKESNKDIMGQANGWIGYHHYAAKEFDKSLPYFKKSVELLDTKSPYLTNFYLMFGAAHHSLKNLKEAKQYYEEVLKRDPNNKSAKESLENVKALLKAAK